MLTPSHWTDKPVGARSRGAAAAELTRTLTGVELMEWQRAVLDVAFSYDPATGLWCFPTVVVSVPRQNGKTVGVIKPAVFDRLAFTTGERTLATSHTLAAARDILFNPVTADLAPFVSTSRAAQGAGAKLGPVTIRYAMGGELVRVNRRPAARSSEFRLIAPTPKASHGYSAATVLIDEAWAFETDELEQAITPTQTAQRNPQLIVVSTAGHEGSRFLRRLVELGRADAPGVCYLEWAAPDGADPSDPATWAAANPAYGVTITERVMRTIFDRMAPTDLAGFERAHLNRWTGSVTPTIPAHSWLACRAAAPSYVDRDTPIAFGADVALDRSAAAIGVAIARPDGRVAVELVKTGDGTEWLAGELAGLVTRHAGRRLVVDRIGPMAPVVAQLERDRVPHTLIKTHEYTAASAGFLDAVTGGNLTHPADPDLDRAVGAASQRTIGEAWAWGRRASSANIAPLVAVTLARWGLVAAPPTETPRVLY